MCVYCKDNRHPISKMDGPFWVNPEIEEKKKKWPSFHKSLEIRRNPPPMPTVGHHQTCVSEIFIIKEKEGTGHQNFLWKEVVTLKVLVWIVMVHWSTGPLVPGFNGPNGNGPCGSRAFPPSPETPRPLDPFVAPWILDPFHTEKESFLYMPRFCLFSGLQLTKTTQFSFSPFEWRIP